MISQIKLSGAAKLQICCPSCKSSIDISKANDSIKCTNKECSLVFPVINGIPILIDEKTSIFLIDDIIQNKNTFFGDRSGCIKRILLKFIPEISVNVRAAINFRIFAQHLLEKNTNPRVLITGSGIKGHGIDALLSDRRSVV